MSLVLNYTVASDRGLVRDNNEDSAYAGPHLLVLADGMGGHAAGEVASALMVEHLEPLDAASISDDVLDLLTNGADRANLSIAETVDARPETTGMGTTLTALKFTGTEFGLIHVGDSRGYRLRDGSLEQLTVDDTFVQRLVNSGQLDPEDVPSHPKKSIILKAYTGAPVEPTLAVLDAQAGDRLLLCSDGLSDPVRSSTIEEALKEGTPRMAAHRLVELALRSGGPDNVTVVVADVVDDETLSDEERAEIPRAPMVGGVLAGDEDNPHHPDTAAGRAAALRAISKQTAAAKRPEPVQHTTEDSTDGGEVGDDEEPGPRAGHWIALTIALVLILGLLGGGWWMYTRIGETFYVATDKDDNFVIEQGVDFSLFSHELHEPVQVACLDEKGALRLADIGKDDQSCNRFGLKDLPETARSSIDALPEASYEDVSQQLQRLAQDALPVCLSTSHATKDRVDGDLTQPGVNCREVK